MAVVITDVGNEETWPVTQAHAQPSPSLWPPVPACTVPQRGSVRSSVPRPAQPVRERAGADPTLVSPTLLRPGPGVCCRLGRWSAFPTGVSEAKHAFPSPPHHPSLLCPTRYAPNSLAQPFLRDEARVSSPDHWPLGGCPLESGSREHRAEGKQFWAPPTQLAPFPASAWKSRTESSGHRSSNGGDLGGLLLLRRTYFTGNARETASRYLVLNQSPTLNSHL